MTFGKLAHYLLIKNIILNSINKASGFLLFLKHNLDLTTSGKYSTPYGDLKVDKLDPDLKFWLTIRLDDLKKLLDHIIAKVKSL